MKAIRLTDKIYWVGAIDWSVRNFHGYSTEKGSTYNAYLIIDEKITLIDTVKAPFAKEMLSRIESVVSLDKLDYIIVNHSEPDHSGALTALIDKAPQATLYADMQGANILKMHYGDMNISVVKANDTLSLGERTLTFLPTPMVHWPDNMVTYCKEEKILFSNDAFGQHYASFERMDTEFNLSVQLAQARKYYANIVFPYSMQVKKAMDAVAGLDIKMILPSHGLGWSEHIADIIEEYRKMSNAESNNKAVIVYDSMWKSTAKMADAIAAGFAEAGVRGVVMDLQVNHISDVMTAVLDSRYIAVGSPTLNNGMLPTVASFLCYLKGLLPKDTQRKYLAFGSYGWGGQSIGLVANELQAMGLQELAPQIKAQFVPDEEKLKEIKNIVINAL